MPTIKAKSSFVFPSLKCPQFSPVSFNLIGYFPLFHLPKHKSFFQLPPILLTEPKLRSLGSLQQGDPWNSPGIFFFYLGDFMIFLFDFTGSNHLLNNRFLNTLFGYRQGRCWRGRGRSRFWVLRFCRRTGFDTVAFLNGLGDTYFHLFFSERRLGVSTELRGLTLRLHPHTLPLFGYQSIAG